MSRSSGRLPGSSGRDDPAHAPDEFDLLSIGFDPGAGGGSSAPPPRTPPPPRPDQVGPDPGIVTPPPPPPPQETERPCPQWITWEIFYTRYDERVCAVCGPLHGREYQSGSGPQPPLHGNCRCYRSFNRRECLRRGAGGSGGRE